MSFKSFELDNVVLNRDFLSELLELGADTAGAPGPLVGALKRFGTSTVAMTPDSLFAELPAAAVLGASTVTVTFSGAVNVGTLKVGIKAQIEEIAGAAPTAEGLYSVWLANAANDDWIAFANLPAPVSIEQQGDGVSVDLHINLPLET